MGKHISNGVFVQLSWERLTVVLLVAPFYCQNNNNYNYRMKSAVQSMYTLIHTTKLFHIRGTDILDIP